MSHNNHKGGAGIYIITAIALGIITYIEFGLIQYNWMEGSSAILTLVALSVVKFLAVISIFMHLKDDNKTLSGFFTAGLLFAFATFIAVSFLFNVNSTKNRMAAPEIKTTSSHEASTENSELLVEAAGFNFPSGPENQSYQIKKPLDDKKDYSFSLDNAVPEPVKNEAAVGSSQSFDWQELGQKTYNNCSSCHQANGNGIPGAFPPLNKNMALKYNADKDYLLKAVVFGLTGEIEVDGSKYNGAMPAWGYLSDEEIAAVVNHALSSWDNPSIVEDFKAYTPTDVAKVRSLELSSADTLDQRP